MTKGSQPEKNRIKKNWWLITGLLRKKNSRSQQQSIGFPARHKLLLVNTGDAENWGGSALVQVMEDLEQYGGYFTHYFREVGITNIISGSKIGYKPSRLWYPVEFRTIPADYDGGTIADLCVRYNNYWKIAYSKNNNENGQANGYFTGSRLPQKFSNENGVILPIYQYL